MKYWIERLSHPIRGLKYALIHDFAIQFEVIVLGVLGFPISYILFGPFSASEWLLLTFCWFLIIITELQNSAIEIALDRVHPERHEAIGRSKDLAAAAVVWSFLFGVISFIFVANHWV